MGTSSEEAEQAVERVDNPFDSGPIVAAPTGSGAAALVQREVAEVQAAMVIAKRFPRDPKVAVDRIVTACCRPALADAALYEYARGGQQITGPSIRLAEELARNWGNIVCGVTEIARHAGHSECLAYAWDLETNFRDEKRFTVRHWRDTKSGGYVIKDERDIYEVVANMGSRRKRACILAVIPGDVTEAAVRQVDLTLNAKVDLSPERLSGMLAAFAKIGVTKEAIEKRIQRRWDSITPALYLQLSRIGNSIKDGMSNPGDWFEMPEGEQTDDRPTATKRVADKLAERKAEPDSRTSHGPGAGEAQDKKS